MRGVAEAAHSSEATLKLEPYVNVMVPVPLGPWNDTAGELLAT
jgi:hypothetical protein